MLYRIEERLRDVGSGNLVTRMTELEFVQRDLSELEDECVEVADIFGVSPIRASLLDPTSALTTPTKGRSAAELRAN